MSRPPAFYAYSYPEPPGYPARPIEPGAAYYDIQAGEFLLPYDGVRTAAAPGDMLLRFFQSAYEAAADLATWERASLERPIAD